MHVFYTGQMKSQRRQSLKALYFGVSESLAASAINKHEKVGEGGKKKFPDNLLLMSYIFSWELLKV